MCIRNLRYLSSSVATDVSIEMYLLMQTITWLIKTPEHASKIRMKALSFTTSEFIVIYFDSAVYLYTKRWKMVCFIWCSLDEVLRPKPFVCAKVLVEIHRTIICVLGQMIMYSFETVMTRYQFWHYQRSYLLLSNYKPQKYFPQFTYATYM